MRIQSKTRSRVASEPTLSTPDILKIIQTEMARKRPFRLRLYGTSMHPTIRNGSWITIEPVGPEDMRAGDILLLASSSQTAMVHRLQRVERSETRTLLYTQADAAEKLDIPVPLSHLVGRVSQIEHAGMQVDLTTWWQRVRSLVIGWKSRWRLWRAKHQ
ncbi:MAG: S24/S26 family peptidase [Blastocatellia bacterium]|nr:S24/S26 family peptidase [Blastocatellia bacterium]